MHNYVCMHCIYTVQYMSVTCIFTDRYLHAFCMSWYSNVQRDGSLLFLTEELILKESGDVIVDGDLYHHWDTTCHRAISQLGKSLEHKTTMTQLTI